MGGVNVLTRLLGIGLLESVAARLSPATATIVQFGLIIIGSLLPIIPLLLGAVHLADLLAYTVLGMAVSVVTTLIRLATLGQPTTTSGFFMLHYSIMIGVLSIVCGVWALILLAKAGPSGGWSGLVPLAIGLLLANAWSIADGWFVRGGRHVTKLWQVVLPGYLRFVPLLFGTVLGAFAYLGDSSEAQKMWIAIGLVLSQTVIDLSLAVAALRTRRDAVVEEGSAVA